MTYPPMTMKVGQRISFTSNPVNADVPPQPVPYDGLAVWSQGGPANGGPIFVYDTPGILALTQGINTQPPSFLALKPGVVNVKCTGTSQGQPLEDDFQITVPVDPAVTFGFVFSPPA